MTNATGNVYDIDVELMLTEALEEAFQRKGMLAPGTDENALALRVEIEEYQKGDAFQRWLMPGLGPTVLEVHCDLREGDQVIGVADARRTVEAGGGYTIGAWKSIFNDVAADVAKDVSTQLGRD